MDDRQPETMAPGFRGERVENLGLRLDCHAHVRIRDFQLHVLALAHSFPSGRKVPANRRASWLCGSFHPGLRHGSVFHCAVMTDVVRGGFQVVGRFFDCGEGVN
jgi:hypothetical protein